MSEKDTPTARTVPMSSALCLCGALLASALNAQDGYQIMHIGNSLTLLQGMPVQLRMFAHDAGHGDHSFMLSYHPGWSIQQLYQNPDSSTGGESGPYYDVWPSLLSAPNSWDYVSVQPYKGHSLADIHFGGAFYDEALKLNPNTRLIVYQQWPAYSETYETAVSTREVAYFEAVAQGIMDEHPGCAPVTIVPAGVVVDTVRRMINKGEFTGISSDSELFIVESDGTVDGIHLSYLGAWVVSLTWFATIYKQDPVVCPNTYYRHTSGQLVDEGDAAKIKAIVWDIVSSYPWAQADAHTSALPRGRDVSRVMQSPAPAHKATFSLTGRVMPSALRNACRGVSVSSSKELLTTPAMRNNGSGM